MQHFIGDASASKQTNSPSSTAFFALADPSCVEFTASLRDARECAEPIVFRFKQEIRMIEWLAEECKRAGSMREKRIALGCGPELARIKERKSKLHAFRITSRIATRHPTVLIQFRNVDRRCDECYIPARASSIGGKGRCLSGF